MSPTSRSVMAVRSNLSSPSSQEKNAPQSPTIQERIADFKKSVCEMTLEYEHLKKLHREQTTDVEGYYKQAQEAIKLNNYSLARKLLIQHRALMAFNNTQASRLEHIERTLPTLKKTLIKLDPEAESVFC
ncbi:hypothetical protein AVDCRST_MAG81-2173 [uncultured Synechococcales cyanobacterium]|uniref:Uncharacterized protein n=1 Tax=uncultured Synechococcales cyanobacterium TaxID=1936017 RepID=A0A6J4VDA7_9CYAN|nr:hypothetical protein AVDCRST_MAG81-2173 [uncultured Synechococcales cyanobacterium]